MSSIPDVSATTRPELVFSHGAVKPYAVGHVGLEKGLWIMNRKLISIAALLLPVAFISAQHPIPDSPNDIDSRLAIQMNELAGHIESLEDAQRLVDIVVVEFLNKLPPRWKTRSLRNRIALNEYQSAGNPRALISEQSIADAWNDYLREIGAPEQNFVTPLEIHTLRDGHYFSSRLTWSHGVQNIWTAPNIYAIDSDGKLVGGCRALETLRIIWVLDNYPESLRIARELVKKGVLLSDTKTIPAMPPASSQQSYGTVRSEVASNSVAAAEVRYLREHGEDALNHAIRGLLKNLFPR
jgi:hypothetical protein